MDAQPQSPLPSAVPQKPRPVNIGGWLFVFLIGLFGIPVSVFVETDSVLDLYDRLPQVPRWGVSICLVLHWGFALVAVYCLYVVSCQKPNAVKSTKRALVLMAILAWIACIIYLLMVAVPLKIRGPNLGGVAVGLGLMPTLWVVIWHAYFPTFRTGTQDVSKRVSRSWHQSHGLRRVMERRNPISEAVSP